MQRKKHNPRTIILCILLCAVLTFYSGHLVSWQIVNHDDYVNQANSAAYSDSYTPITAARGEILDRYGRPIVTNTEGYDIVFYRAYLPDEKLNGTILTLTRLLSSSKEDWTDNAPLSQKSPYKFKENSRIPVSSMLSELGLNTYATPENCASAMIKEFKLSAFTAQQQRTIMGVRLTMMVADYAETIPYKFAENISLATVTKIEESSSALPGVICEVSANRNYSAVSKSMTHIIGNTGLIYADEWDDYKSKGYSYNDYVGKMGIEKAAESYLRGTDGKMKVTRDNSGKVTDSEIAEKPQNGNTITLTIDSNLQNVCYNALAKAIAERNQTKTGANADAGAIVVMNVNNGEVLASVNYPTYDMKTYNKNYQSLIEDSHRPLFNRDLNGIYAPGSTFKPATASIGLHLKKISAYDTITCVHTYTYYKDYQPRCMGYHGSINVMEALSVSCNYFFYEVGRRIGITNLNKYCRLLGLGVKTGVELPEASGILAGPDYRESIKSDWQAGDTLQAAIGQSDNSFTPIQLATYTSTVANSGTRYRAKFIKNIYNYNLSKIVKEATPEVVDKTGIEKEVFDVVKKGMLSVTSEGTASGAFGNYPIRVGGKTGTATAYYDGVEYDNAVFIAFAPYDNPEIAIVILGEKAGHGSVIASAAEEILNAYFYYEGDTYKPQQSGELLQ